MNGVFFILSKINKKEKLTNNKVNSMKFKTSIPTALKQYFNKETQNANRNFIQGYFMQR